MANSIWARIETELDAATQEPGTEKQSNTNIPRRNGPIRLLRPGIIIAAAAVIIAAAWIFNKQRAAKKINPIPILKEEKKNPVAADSSNTMLLPGKKSPPLKINDADPGIPVLKNSDSMFFPVDNGLSQPQREPVINDSALVKPSLLIPAADSSKSTLPQVKPRGVKGISENDYKIISVKKDTAKNKN